MKKLLQLAIFTAMMGVVAATASADMKHKSHGATPGQASSVMPPVAAHNAWVPVAPPNSKVLAGYLTLHNHGKEQRAITGVSSPQFEAAEIHASSIKDGIAVMEHLAQVDLPAGAMVSFKPGGLHFMLMKPKSVIGIGDQIDIHLQFDDGSSLAVQALVTKRPKGRGGHMHHKHGS